MQNYIIISKYGKQKRRKYQNEKSGRTVRPILPLLLEADL